MREQDLCLKLNITTIRNKKHTRCGEVHIIRPTFE